MIVGITGYKGSGKDTAADVLVKEFGFTKYSFAEPIRDICKIMFGWGDERFLPENKELVDLYWGISPRQAMQVLGTDFSQHMLSDKFPDFAQITGRKLWVKKFVKHFKENPEIKNWVIPDFRFPHERDILLGLNAYFFKILRYDVFPIGNQIHESEAYIERMQVDIVIPNNGKKSTFENEVKNTMKDLQWNISKNG